MNYQKAKDFIITLVIGLLLILGVMKIIKYDYDQETKEIFQRKAEVVGTIVDSGNMKGNYVEVEYFFKGKNYRDRTNSGVEYKIGEHYKVLVDSLKPMNFRIDFTDFVLLNHQKIMYTEGVIIDDLDDRVLFKYYINGERYERFQKVINREGKKVHDFKLKKQYRVIYLEYDPRIAYLESDNEIQ